jgi:hypothetical protein
MIQTQLDRAIAARTGERLARIRHHGFSLMNERRDEPTADDLRLVVHCPFCNGQVPYPGRSGDGSNVLAECPGCDVYFEFDDCDVYPAGTGPGRAPVSTRSRYLPA